MIPANHVDLSSLILGNVLGKNKNKTYGFSFTSHCEFN